MGCKCKISIEINSNVSKMIQANSLLFNFQMKSPCYLVTLSLESSDFQTFLKQCQFSAFGALIFYRKYVLLQCRKKIYWFQTKSYFEIYWSDLSDLSHVAAKLFLFCMVDGWMTCDFTSFSTVFQSYQDDGQMIMKGCVQWNPFMVEKISPSGGIDPGTFR